MGAIAMDDILLPNAIPEAMQAGAAVDTSSITFVWIPAMPVMAPRRRSPRRQGARWHNVRALTGVIGMGWWRTRWPP